MKRSWVFAWTVLWAVGFYAVTLQTASPQQRHAPPYRIAGLQAKLFYEHSATFSEDIFANPHFTLHNVFIGGGDAKEPTTSTLVLIVVIGQSGAYEPTRKVEITATRKPRRKNHGESVLRRVVGTGILSKEGKQYLPLWLYNTGVEPITIKARLLGQGASTTIQKTINFHSGE